MTGFAVVQGLSLAPEKLRKLQRKCETLRKSGATDAAGAIAEDE